MRNSTALLGLLLLFFSCKQKVLSGKDLEKKLVETMQHYLDNEGKQRDVDFHVKDVLYYTDVREKKYDCEFHVNMHSEKLDTVGLMKAAITNDFKKVKRIQ